MFVSRLNHHTINAIRPSTRIQSFNYASITTIEYITQFSKKLISARGMHNSSLINHNLTLNKSWGRMHCASMISLSEKRNFGSISFLMKESKDNQNGSSYNTESLKKAIHPTKIQNDSNNIRDIHDLSKEYMNPSIGPEKIREIERKAKSLNSSDGERIQAFFSRLQNPNAFEDQSKFQSMDNEQSQPISRYEDKIDDSLPQFYRQLRKEIEKDSEFYHRYEIIFLESEDDYSPEYATYNFDKSADINRIGHDPNSFGMTHEDPAIVHWLDQLSAPLRDKLVTKQKKYKRVMRAFSVADYRDNPAYVASSGSCWVWIEENSPIEKILVQLGNHVPPTMWIPLKPKKDSLKKLFDEVTAMEAGGAGRIMESTDEMLSKINFNNEKVEVKAKQENLLQYINNYNPEMIENSFPNTFTMFLGNTNDIRTIEESFMNNPYTFNTPVILGSSNKHTRGKPIVISKFRTTLTRSIITLIARYDFQLHLTANDEDSSWNIPVFAIVNFPDNSFISKPIPQRVNKMLDVQFPENAPFDVIGALLPYKMRTWQSVKNYISNMDPSSVPPQTIAQLAVLGDENFSEILNTYKDFPDPVYRIACVIGASYLGMNEEAIAIMEKESKKEIKDIMTTYIRN